MQDLILPLVPIRDVVVFPKSIVSISLKRSKSVSALEDALLSGKNLFLVMQRDKEIDDPKRDDLFQFGTICKIVQVQRLPDGVINILVEGETRAKIKAYLSVDPFFKVNLEEIEESKEFSSKVNELVKVVIEEFRELISLGKAVSIDVLPSIFDHKDPTKSLDLIIFNLDLNTADKQKLLETVDFEERLKITHDHLSKELAVIQTARKIQDRTAEEIGKSAKEAYLREQLKTIEKELGMKEDKEEFKELESKIKASKMPKETEEKALKELDRLKKMPPFSPEISYVRTYLDWLVDLPWSKKDESKIDIKESEKILDQDHYGLKKVKERIVEYLAIQKLTGKIKGPILCFVGPPGTGKTSVGKSIARSMGRKFIRMSLGGIRDEAEIRGHRRTYVGALPGRIIQGIKNAGTKNPVFMLDEIDKIGVDFRGDPSAALLEALDPEQNHSFSDHYLEAPFDLSEVLFVCTANVLFTIPPALIDRMEILEFPGYTEEEKANIADKFLVPKQLEAHGLNIKQLKISMEALKTIVSSYTREAGVRELERLIATIYRKVAKALAEGKKSPGVVSKKSLRKYLGPEKYELWTAEKKNEIGVANALAWTETGGDVLSVESTLMPGKGNLILTGHLGDVMKESAQAALSYARVKAKEFGVPEKFFKDADIHVHVPSGAIPKDGPSAGIAMATTLVSTLTKKPTKKEVGMTGEVTLRGHVLEIGGVKEKVLGAHRAGLKEIIMPKKNKKDLFEIPAKTKKDLKFHFVEHLDEVLKIAMAEELKIVKEKPTEAPQVAVPTTPS